MRPPTAHRPRRPPHRRRLASIFLLAASLLACGGGFWLVTRLDGRTPVGFLGVAVASAAGVVGWYGCVWVVGHLILGREAR